MKQHTEPRKL